MSGCRHKSHMHKQLGNLTNLTPLNKKLQFSTYTTTLQLNIVKYDLEAGRISYIDLLYLSLSYPRKYQTPQSQVAVPSCVSGIL